MKANRTNLSCVIAVSVLMVTSANCATAQQQITTTTPYYSINDSYSESFGIGFNFSGPGFFFNNGFAGAAPPFGPVPSGASFGGGGRIGGVNFGWNAFAGQGSSRSMVMEAPSLTTMNGAGGFFYSGSVRPFVTGIIPVVSDRPVSPVELSLQQMSASGGLEQRLATRREEKQRAEQAEPAEILPPLPTQDDPPLILNGGSKSERKQ